MDDPYYDRMPVLLSGSDIDGWLDGTLGPLRFEAIRGKPRSTCYPLSYCDIEELLLERGLEIDHSTVNRWVLAYALLIERCTCRSDRATAAGRLSASCGRALRGFEAALDGQ